MAGLGLGMVVGAMAAAGVPAYQRGWVSLVPGWVLVRVAPAEEPSSGAASFTVLVGVRSEKRSIGAALTNEAWARVWSGSLAPLQADVFVRRHLVRHGVGPEDLIWIPERWYRETAVPIQVYDPSSLGCWLGATASAAAIVDGGDRALSYSPGRSALEPLPAGTESVDFEIALQAGSRAIYGARISKACALVEFGEPLLVGVSDAATDRRVRALLRPYLRWKADGTAEIIAGDRVTTPEWRALNMGLGFRVEVMRDSEVLGAGHGAAVWGRAEWKVWQEARIEWTAGGLEKAAANKERLRLVVRGVRAESEESYVRSPFGKSARYWAGHFEVPAGLEEGEKAPEGAPK